MRVEELLQHYLLLTRNLITAAEAEWGVLFGERQAVIDQISSLDPFASDLDILPEIEALERELQKRIAKESAMLRLTLVESFSGRQNVAQYQDSVAATTKAIEC